LYWVGRSDLNRLPARIRRLFACACVRRVRHLLRDERSRRAIEVAERFADGEVSRQELDATALVARAAAEEAPVWAASAAARAAAWVAADEALEAVEAVARAAAEEVIGPERIRSRSTFLDAAFRAAMVKREADRQERLLWDLMEDVLPPEELTISPDWLTSTVMGVARWIYDQRDFTVLPVLTDALEEAGCTEERLLSHFRSGAEHIRGCWALDVLLGSAAPFSTLSV
jgi:hypothetical protein